MDSTERLKTALAFQEPDRVPVDLGATTVTTITKVAFEKAMAFRGLNGKGILPVDIDPIQQIVFPSNETLDILQVDTRRLGLPRLFGEASPIQCKDGKFSVTDQFGCRWEFDPSKDHYYNQTYSPLKQFDSVQEGLANYTFPSLEGRREEVFRMLDQQLSMAKDNRPLVLDRNCAGITEVAMRIRGYEEFFMDTALDPVGVERLLDGVLSYKLLYWEYMGEYVKTRNLQSRALVAAEADDLGTQDSLLFSPETLRALVLKRQETLFQHIKKMLPGIKVFYHTDGAIFDLIPDLIRAGVDILNPVQFSARGMDLAKLKKEYGKQIVFWGAGIDTQETLPRGTPQQIKEEVRRNIEILAPGGGFVCATVHNIQSDVPPQNFWAYWEAVQEYGNY